MSTKSECVSIGTIEKSAAGSGLGSSGQAPADGAHGSPAEGPSPGTQNRPGTHSARKDKNSSSKKTRPMLCWAPATVLLLAFCSQKRPASVPAYRFALL